MNVFFFFQSDRHKNCISFFSTSQFKNRPISKIKSQKICAFVLHFDDAVQQSNCTQWLYNFRSKNEYFCNSFSDFNFSPWNVIFHVYFNFPASDCDQKRYTLDLKILIYLCMSECAPAKEIYALHRVNNALNMMFIFFLVAR